MAAGVGITAGVVGALLGGIGVGLPPLATGVLVLAAFAGTAAVANGLNLLRQPQAGAGAASEGPTLAEIAAAGRREAATFGRLAERIRDGDLRRRVGHLGERLAVVFTELERRPEALEDMQAVRSFVSEVLPRAVMVIERYIELSERFSDVDPARLSAIRDTVHQIADAVKGMHDRLMNHELAEFASINLMLQADLELDQLTLQPRRGTEGTT